MTAFPYRPGDMVARLEVDGERLSVRAVPVLTVTRLDEERSSVTTETDIVVADNEGVGRDHDGVRIIPIDEELKADLDLHPDGLVVEESTRDIEREQEMDRGDIDRGL